MNNIKELPASKRKEEFYESLNLSSTTTNNYKSALHSSFLLGILRNSYNVLDLFEIVDLHVLWELYTRVNLHPKNISNHRAYSAALMKYIKFLNNGQKYGRRIDYGKSRLEGEPLSND